MVVDLAAVDLAAQDALGRVAPEISAHQHARGVDGHARLEGEREGRQRRIDQRQIALGEAAGRRGSPRTWPRRASRRWCAGRRTGRAAPSSPCRPGRPALRGAGTRWCLRPRRAAGASATRRSRPADTTGSGATPSRPRDRAPARRTPRAHPRRRASGGLERRSADAACRRRSRRARAVPRPRPGARSSPRPARPGPAPPGRCSRPTRRCPRPHPPLTTTLPSPRPPSAIPGSREGETLFTRRHAAPSARRRSGTAIARFALRAPVSRPSRTRRLRARRRRGTRA